VAAGALLVPSVAPDLEVETALTPEPEAEAAPLVAPAAAAAPAARYSTLRLSAGIVGRIILSFVAGCLAISLLPLLLGWHPYVVKSGAMEPRITVGDIVLASPDHNPSSLLGHVTVF